MSEWQPIETAPKEDRPIIVKFDVPEWFKKRHGDWFVVQRGVCGWNVCSICNSSGCNNSIEYAPIKWMEPPK